MALSGDASSERGHRYGDVIDRLTQERYVCAAQDVLARMSSDERKQLVETLRAQARKQDVNEPGLHDLQSLDHPDTLGGLFGNLRLNAPGLLEQLLDGTPYYERVFGGIAEAARG